MSTVRITIISIFGVLVMSMPLHAQGWRGLVPLHSTRADVERLLGAPIRSKGVASTFETKDGRVLAFYSNGGCNEDPTSDWNVPPGTLLTITVHQNYKLPVKDLRLDSTKYERMSDFHVQGIVYYFSKEDGVRISARVLEDNNEYVDNTTYEPRSADG